MSTTAKASDHVKPCNIEQSERHNRRDAEYLASLNPRTLYVRTELSHNNESYVVPDLKGVTLQQHYDAIKAMVKQKTGRAMQEKKVTVIGKNGKPKERNGSSPIRESVVNIKPDTTMADLRNYTQKVQERWGVRAIQIHIHKDEGHYTNPDDPSTWQSNLHAHIIWDWMNHETGKSYKLGKKDMEELQDMAAETLDMERGQRKSETGAEHLERNDFILQKQKIEKQENLIAIEKQKKEKLENQTAIEKQKKEIDKMAHATLFDKLFNSNLSPNARKAFEEKDATHKEELRKAITAVDSNGCKLEWTNGKKKGQLLTWPEYMRVLEKKHSDEIVQIEADKESAIAKIKSETEAEIRTMNNQLTAKDERIKSLNGKITRQDESNRLLKERLNAIKDILLAGFSMNFRKVIQIIIDQWKAEAKHFTKVLKDFLRKAMSGEKTSEGRKSFVNDAFWYAKIVAKTDADWKPDEKKLKSLEEDANRIADGTWDAYHEKRDLLFDTAVNALVAMGNCSYQRRLSGEQATAIEAYLSIEGEDRDLLAIELWDAASPKIDHYWRDVTFNALEELRTKEFYNHTNSNNLKLW